MKYILENCILIFVLNFGTNSLTAQIHRQIKPKSDEVVETIISHSSLTLNSSQTRYFVGKSDTTPFNSRIRITDDPVIDSTKVFQSDVKSAILDVISSQNISIGISDRQASLQVDFWGSLNKRIDIESHLRLLTIGTSFFDYMGHHKKYVDTISLLGNKIYSPLFSYHIDSTVISVTCGDLLIRNTDINWLNMDNLFVIHGFKIDSCTFSYITLNGATLPDTVTIRNLNLTGVRDVIDFRNVRNKSTITIRIANTDLTKFLFPLDKTDFLIETYQTYEQQALLYQQILKQLKDAGLTEKYEKNDKLFQELKLLHNNHPVLNWIAKYWWDYGYDKGRIFYISFAFFIFFFILNTVFIHQLQQVFFPETFISKRALVLERTRNPTPFAARLYQLPGLFLYTAYIFWGLKLGLKQVKITNWIAVALILLQYIVGIVCLAYLANYVISK